MKDVHRKEYDAELAVLEAVRPGPECTFSQSEIAEVCGVSRQAVRHVERSALRKIGRALTQRGIIREVAIGAH